MDVHQFIFHIQIMVHLQSYVSIMSLQFSLRNNNIGYKGAKFLGEALKMNQVLVSIK